MQSWIEEKLDNLPTSPGVYLMKDRAGTVIYVGKAVNLRNRVRSYFTRTGDTRAFVALLDELLGDLETVVVSNEKEALLLENELIKQHKPRFNVQMRDDKAFICLRIDRTHPYPRLEIVRRIQRDGARYFGPYSSASSIREMLRIINRYFGLRTCSDHVIENRSRPCLLHQIGRCPAPCVLDIPREEYAHSVDEVILFLEGKASELVDGLKVRMREASSKLEFEHAARLRDQLFAIERSLERQKIATTDFKDQDVFGLYRQADRLLIYLLYVRRGRITGGQSFPFSGQEFPDEELIASFVNLYYDHDNFVPEEVLLPVEPEGVESLEALLSERRGAKVRVITPQRGEKHALVKMANTNAEQTFQDRKRSRDETEAVLLQLKERLHLTNLPRRMECFDISHFGGSSIVASQVATTDGEADRARYRRYRLKTVLQNDDFASMHEILTRRFKRGVKDGDLPDLIVIDGGKGQLAAAHAAMKDVAVEGVDLISLAKSRDLDVVDRDAESKRSPERVFLLGRKDPIVLKQNSAALFMLTRLRDEAHRFAITFQQKSMRRRNFTSTLEDIPGVGEGRKKALLRHFGSLKRVRDAQLEEIAKVPGIPLSLAERIHAHLHDDDAHDGSEEELEDTVRAASLEDAGAPEEHAEVGIEPPVPDEALDLERTDSEQLIEKSDAAVLTREPGD